MAGTPDIWPLLSTVFQSILEVFLLCLAGYILAWRHIIDKPTQRVINHINISLFTPALLFSKVAFFLSPAKLKELWIIPIFFVVVTSLSGLIAAVLSRVFRLRRSQRHFAMAASMFMNSNSLPIALMQSLVLSVHDLKWTPDDNKDAMLGRALTYLVLYSTLGMMLRWSYGVRLLSSADVDTPTSSRSPSLLGVACTPTVGVQYVDDHDGSLLGEEVFSEHRDSPRFHPTTPSHHWQTRVPSANTFQTEAHPTSPSHHWQTQVRSQSLSPRLESTDDDDDDEGTACETPALLPDSVASTHRTQPHLYLLPTRRHEQQGSSSISHTQSPHTLRPAQETAIYHSFPNSPSRALAPLSLISVTPSDSEDEVDRAADITTESFQQHRHRSRMYHTFRRIWKGIRKRLYQINEFITVPLWASLLSLIVACTTPLQSALESMTPIKGALGAAGNCSIPLTLVVLGAYFYTSEPRAKEMRNGDLTYTEIDGARQHLQHQKSRSSIFNAVHEIFSPQPTVQSQLGMRGEGKTVLVAILSRMVVVPAVMLPVMAILAKYDLHDVLEDPVFVVSNVLLIASPPALTLAQITQAASNDSFERLVSRTVFWSYCVVTPPSTILVVVLGLLIAKL